ncbi:hypothetical protein [Kordia sp.]|uniref:hypothetical protein n=1 Tax=Kordia sp. TaxID=1965332 RepID=UPI0025C09FC2|nr:hypothetical protein [Kordia sp.]MCH2194690.1 hypothetical protein [Kordia sp.]
MKKLYTFLVAIILTATTFAQAPEKMSYQAVVRDSGDAFVTNQVIGMQISILKTTATGTAVYVETQTPTTNVNGLVTVEIGTGTPVTGTFAGIDWSADTYFIKTETDPAGGTNYSITGTSQLLSVPYALHAKTAASVTETQTLTDVVALGNTVNNQLKLVTDPTEPQDAATKAYVDALEVQLAALEDRITALEPKIGDSYLGGIIFYIYEPGDAGYVPGESHGLIAATSDQSTGIQWTLSAFHTAIAGAASYSDGAANTDAIIAQTGAAPANTYAAGLCRLYSTSGNNDQGLWYLPSKDELNLMYANIGQGDALGLGNIGNFYNSGYYWTSTELITNAVFLQGFLYGNVVTTTNMGIEQRVRAVKAF